MSLVLNKVRVAQCFLILELVLLWLCAIPAFSGYLAALWERQYLPVAVEDSPDADVIVVLGGAVEGVVPPRLEEDLGDGADRVLHAMRLFKAGKATKILVVGGNLPWLGVDVAEAEVIKSLLMEWGVPSDEGLDILSQGLSMSIQEQPLPYIRRTILEFVFPGDEGVAWWDGLGGLCQGFGLRFSPLLGEEILVLSHEILNLHFE